VGIPVNRWKAPPCSHLRANGWQSSTFQRRSWKLPLLCAYPLAKAAGNASNSPAVDRNLLPHDKGPSCWETYIEQIFDFRSGKQNSIHQKYNQQSPQKETNSKNQIQKTFNIL
jgi:hypothetical protein